MTLLFADGFDIYADRADVGQTGWFTNNASLDLSTTGGRFGGGCLTATVANDWRCPAVVPIGSTVIICFAYYFNNLPNSTSTFRALVGGSTQGDGRLFSVESNNTGAMRCFGQSGKVGSDVSDVFVDQTWQWIEVKVVLGTTASNGSLEVRVDGMTKFSETGIDTFNNSNSILNSLYFTGRAGGGVRIDDVIIMDGNGSTMNDYIGNARIDTLIPNSNGTEDDWVASAGSQYQCLDDVIGGSNDNTDYVYLDSPGLLDLQMSNIVGNPATIYAVQTRTRVSKSDVGVRTFRTNLLSSASTANGLTKGFPIGYSWLRNGIFEKDPNGDVAWTKAAVDALQVQLEMLS